MFNNDHELLLSIENIYQSVAELSVREYLKSHKEMLLNPKLSMHSLYGDHIFPLTEETTSKNDLEQNYCLWRVQYYLIF